MSRDRVCVDASRPVRSRTARYQRWVDACLGASFPCKLHHRCRWDSKAYPRPTTYSRCLNALFDLSDAFWDNCPLYLASSRSADRCNCPMHTSHMPDGPAWILLEWLLRSHRTLFIAKRQHPVQQPTLTHSPPFFAWRRLSLPTGPRYTTLL